MSRSEYLAHVDALAVVLLALDSDEVGLSRPEAKAIARHVVRSEWLAAYAAQVKRPAEVDLLSLRDEKRAQARFANREDYPGSGDYDHGVAHGINVALGREFDDE